MTRAPVVSEELMVEVGDGLRMAVSVYHPAAYDHATSGVVAFAFPGGGYSRDYYDIGFDGDAYSQATFHVTRGWTFIVCDHLGTGASDATEPSLLTIAALAEASDAAVRAVVDQMSLSPELVVGIGQSMGGCISIAAQGAHRTFDALAVLGFSVIQTVVPTPDGHSVEQYSDAERATRDMVRWAFHSDDADRTLVETDLASGYPFRADPVPPWGTSRFPHVAASSMLDPGVVADEAALIDVPVFIGCGTRDVVPDVRAEPAAYRASSDITVLTVSGMAHMHNFAPSRRRLWARLHAWAEALRGDA